MECRHRASPTTQRVDREGTEGKPNRGYWGKEGINVGQDVTDSANRLIAPTISGPGGAANPGSPSSLPLSSAPPRLRVRFSQAPRPLPHRRHHLGLIRAQHARAGRQVDREAHPASLFPPRHRVRFSQAPRPLPHRRHHLGLIRAQRARAGRQVDREAHPTSLFPPRLRVSASGFLRPQGPYRIAAITLASSALSVRAPAGRSIGKPIQPPSFLRASAPPRPVFSGPNSTASPPSPWAHPRPAYRRAGARASRSDPPGPPTPPAL